MNKKPENMTTEELKKNLFNYEKEFGWLEKRIAKLKTELRKRNED